ncbi:MAG: hypothetical protein M1831_005016 [Alyxoria varia]|nr:MAG: hypothetical protein M1831_005016 [Alyxoria varia]
MANLRSRKATPVNAVAASERNAEPTRQSARQRSQTAEPAPASSKTTPSKPKGRPPKAQGKKRATKKLESVAENEDQDNEQAVVHGNIPLEAPVNHSLAPSQAQSEANDAITTVSQQYTNTFKSGMKRWPVALIDLNTKADTICSSVLPRSKDGSDHDLIATELQKPDSVRSGRLRIREIGFENAFENFSYEHWIPRDLVVCMSEGVRSFEEVETGPWRPDSVLYKANLAVLAKFFMTHDENHTDTLPFLQGLDEIFPTPFLASFVSSNVAKTDLGPGESTLTQATFDIALDIRTLMATMIIRQEPNGDNSMEILNSIFVEANQPKGWSILFGEDGPGGLSSKLGLPNRVTDKLAEIHRILDNPEFDIEHLDNLVDYRGLRYKIMAWLRSRKAEADEQIETCGGPDAISEAWEDEIKAARTRIEDPPYMDFTYGNTEARNWLLKQMQVGDEAEQRSSRQTDQPTGGEIAEEVNVEQNFSRPPGRVTHADQRVQAAQARALTQPQGTLQRPKRFTDPQANARRVSPIQFSQDGVSTQNSNLESRINRGGTYASTEDNVTQDPGFQNHERTEADVQANRQQANAMPRNRHQQRKRKIPADDESYRDSPAQGTPKRQRPAAPAAAQPPFEGTPISSRPANLPDSGYGEVNRNAKMVRNDVKDVHNFQPQNRTPWTQDETDALIAAIGKLGPRYSKIKREDEEDGGFHLLINRNQVNLKDKARNMKFDYLKSGYELPQGFDFVMIPQGLIKKLHEMGITYEQDKVRKRNHAPEQEVLVEQQGVEPTAEVNGQEALASQLESV